MAPAATIASRFLSALPEARRAALTEQPDLEGILASAVERARSTWPDLSLTTLEFAAHLARHWPEGKTPSEAVESLQLGDLYLAWGCAQGDSKSIEHLRRAHLAGVEQSLRGLRNADATGDEIESRVLEHVLVAAPGRAPRISEYSGRGSLRGWLQVAATRLLLTSMRGGRAETSDDAVLLDLPSPLASPDLQALKNRYRTQFNEAFREAISALSPRERNLLRQHYLDGLTTEELANLYRVNRATAVRWLAAAREALLEGTRKAAVERLGVRPQDFESLLSVVRSQLEVSLPVFFSRS